ncbi:hypothetical protein ACFQU7_19330 [Pseudoroseomonas wenyumeiae]
MSLWLALGLVSLLIWLVLVLARGGFWLARERDDRDTPSPPPTGPAWWPWCRRGTRRM